MRLFTILIFSFLFLAVNSTAHAQDKIQYTDVLGNRYTVDSTIIKTKLRQDILRSFITSEELAATIKSEKNIFLIMVIKLEKLSAKKYRVTVKRSPENNTIEETLKYIGDMYFEIQMEKKHTVKDIIFIGIQI